MCHYKMAELELPWGELVQLSYFNKGKIKVRLREGVVNWIIFPSVSFPYSCDFAKLCTVGREYFLPPLILHLAI